MSTYRDLIYTLRWFALYAWNNKKSKSGAIQNVSKALTLATDEGDVSALYTLRWYFVNRWGFDKLTQLEVVDLITELLEDAPTHVDHDRLPNPNAIVDPEEEELKYYRPELKKPFIKEGLKVGLAIGHNKYTGASSYEGDDEWITRKAVTIEAQKLLAEFGVESKIFIRDRSLGYGSAMSKHGRDMKSYGSGVNVEMHFNSYNETSTGTEMIVSSSKSGNYFKPLCKNFAKNYDLPLRGKEGIQLRPSGRGSGFCRRTPGRSGVWEPCFASSSDWLKVDDKPKEEGQVFAYGLLECLENDHR